MRIVPLLLVAALFLSSCEEKMKPAVTAVVTGEDLPSQESWNTKIIFSDSGKTKAVLHAGHIMVFDEKRYTLLDSNVVVDFFDRNEKHTSVLTARHGRVNDITHDFEAYDHVVVVSDSGTTLKSEELFWDNATQKIHTPAFVDIVSPTEHIQGHGLESDQSLKNYKILEVAGNEATK
jgi:LPS export ABC transporter protein LptC